MKKLTATILGVVFIGTLLTGCGSEEKASAPQCPTGQHLGQDGRCHESNPKSVVVAYDITDASWVSEFGYGPYFKVALPAMTKFDCSWTAFDINKVSVGTQTATYNTGNDGSAIAYGTYETGYIESTKEVAKSVKSYDVTCWRK